MRVFILILFVLCSSIKVFAQKPTLMNRIFGKTIYDTNYVVSYYDDLQITLVGVSRKNSVKLYDKISKKHIDFRANNSFNFGFGLDYKFLTIELTRGFENISSPDPAKGETNSFGFRAGLTGKKYLASFLIQSYQGMYVNNPKDFDPKWDIEAKGYPLRPDVISTTFFGSVYYNFNASRYSIMSSLWQLDQQKKSAGGVLTGITLSGNSITSDTSFFINKTSVPIDPSNKIVTTSSSLIGLNIGYGYNYILNNYFISGLVVPGINKQQGTYINTSGESRDIKTRVGVHGDFRFITGYNGYRYYWGLHYANYIIRSRYEDSFNVYTANTYLRLFIGRRLHLNERKKKKK